jgi:tRNA uridine 5-carboxymethylaminomethyl modification enzyme
VVLTNGTFLNGQIHIGDKTLVEEGESASHGITEDLINAGFEGRMNRNASKSGWTFFGLFENERRKGDAKPDKFLF